MKNIALGLMLLLLISIIVEPFVEMSNVLREKIMLGSALTNACRAAKDRSLEYESHRDRDAVINEQKFREYFAAAFADALNLTRTSSTNDTLKFTSNNDRFHEFTVTLDIQVTTNDTGQKVTMADVRAESEYKFKTKYLKLANEVSDVGFELISERKLFVQITN